MISHKHKFIFVHIPKTAGSSICAALNLGPPRHLPLKFHTHTETYFKFAIARNIYDKVVSWYFFHRKSQPELKEYHTKDFAGWIKNGCKVHSIPFDGRKNQMKGISPLSDIHFLEDFDKQIHLDFICKFENLQEDFNVVCDKIGISRRQLPHAKKIKHKHYTEYYDDETRQIVAEKFAKDIEYFGYKFGE
jgi:chondroitin 4-sulfotransferase 11